MGTYQHPFFILMPNSDFAIIDYKKFHFLNNFFKSEKYNTR